MLTQMMMMMMMMLFEPWPVYSFSSLFPTIPPFKVNNFHTSSNFSHPVSHHHFFFTETTSLSPFPLSHPHPRQFLDFIHHSLLLPPFLTWVFFSLINFPDNKLRSLKKAPPLHLQLISFQKFQTFSVPKYMKPFFKKQRV